MPTPLHNEAKGGRVASAGGQWLEPVDGRIASALVTQLVGRRSERGVLDQLIAGLGAGASGALVVRGEPGVGKTALLDYIVEQASGSRVLRTAGIQSEM